MLVSEGSMSSGKWSKNCPPHVTFVIKLCVILVFDYTITHLNDIIGRLADTSNRTGDAGDTLVPEDEKAT